MAKTFIVVLDSCGDPIYFLRKLVQDEVSDTKTPAMIFRQNSGRSRLMSMYICKRVLKLYLAYPWYQDQLGKLLALLCQADCGIAPVFSTCTDVTWSSQAAELIYLSLTTVHFPLTSTCVVLSDDHDGATRFF